MVRQNWSDEDLAQRLQQRDPDALETLISRYSREVYYFIRLVLDGIGVVQDAEECVNDLFVAVWQEIDTFEFRTGNAPYLANYAGEIHRPGPPSPLVPASDS